MSIFHTVIQGSDVWFSKRLGIPTASCFNKIITPTGKLSAQAGEYAHLLLAEIIMQESLDKFPPTYWMERGALLEEDAADLYEFETGYKLKNGGFMTDDLKRWGASPDRRIFNAEGELVGALEIKCPAPWTHVRNLLAKEIDKAYIPQVQGQMLIGELEFVDWFSYHPDMPPSLIHIPRDDEYIKKLERGLEQFSEMMQEKTHELISMEALAPTLL